jgi:predicted Rossmann fold nucleotide-binding protein DprA/Smf involved in DNA uptake
MINLGVIGSRTFDNYKFLEKALNYFFSTKIESIISGGAKGADSLAEEFAKQKGIKIVVHKPNWDEFGKSAGFKRNHQIVEESDILVAFWDGESKGTKHSIKLAKDKKIPTFIFYI